jgi:hypothetical protein
VLTWVKRYLDVVNGLVDVRSLFKTNDELHGFYAIGLEAALGVAEERTKTRQRQARLKRFIESKTNSDCTRVIYSFLQGEEEGI